MTFQFTPTAKSADAPDIEPGIWDAQYEGAVLEDHPDWAGKDSYGNADTGERLRWTFTLLDDTGAVVYDAGDPVEVTTLTNLKMNPKAKTLSKPLRFLKAIMTADEYDAFTEGTAPDSESLTGRKVQVELFIKDSGWPDIANVLPARRSRRAPASEE